MTDRSLFMVLKPALIAGLIAGALAGGFHFLWTEPVIDRAVAIEEGSSSSSRDPVVSRTAQRAGLVLGFLLYGSGWGLLLGILIHLTRNYFPAWSVARRSLVLAAVLGWSVAIFPLLKYPANPPGVGSPETVEYRQELFLTSIGLSILGAVFAVILMPYLKRMGRLAWPMALALYGAYLLGIFFALPSYSEPSQIPPQLISTFRVLSLSGQLLFWCVLALASWRFYDRNSPPLGAR